MLSCFNLDRDEDIMLFSEWYTDFVATMQKLDLVEFSGPIGRRQTDTPMDTDNERNHQYFVIMSFRDREQVDNAYDYILKHLEPGETEHNRIFKPVKEPVFICWQDLI